MKLSFNTPYKSIESFPAIDLPDFSLVTGVNGAGKTHLLTAIGNGQITTDLSSNPQQQIRFFDWNSLIPNNAGSAHVSNIRQKQQQICELAKQTREQHSQALANIIHKYSLEEGAEVAGKWALLSYADDDVRHLMQGPKDALANQAIKDLRNLAQQSRSSMFQQVKGNPQERRIYESLEQKLHPRPFVSITLRDMERMPFDWNQADMFKQSFADMFLQYFQKQKTNWQYKVAEDEGQLEGVYLPQDKFFELHGNPPWEFVNKTFEDAGLEFRITNPEIIEAETFSPKLINQDTGIEMDFSDLSSGEKVLMSFALCLYYSLDKRQVIDKPKILLFDEIDAPLHPSMSKQLIGTILKTLVQDENIKVIMTTHSPSTVAVAPDESVYVMRPKFGLEKVAKEAAIAVLTEDIPTLSIDFEGRRQVFVEDDKDARRYEKIYQIFRRKLSSERSLTFIGVGRNGQGTTGCAQVKTIVENLTENGNKSVFGLIDWDKVNDPKDRLFVLAHGKRYAIENCILDPLLVAAMVIREQPEMRNQLGLLEEENYMSIKGLDATRLQVVSDKTVDLILTKANVKKSSICSETYSGGFSIDIAESYLQLKGHDLERATLEALPCLKRYNQSGQLMLEIINKIMPDLNELVPAMLLNIFDDILNA